MASDENNSLFIFGGSSKKFGEDLPFVALYKPGMFETKMEHLDTKVIENLRGEVTNIEMKTIPDQEITKFVIAIGPNVLLMEISKDKIYHLKSFRNIHKGKIHFFC